jgi:hypothetical protein
MTDDGLVDYGGYAPCPISDRSLRSELAWRDSVNLPAKDRHAALPSPVIREYEIDPPSRYKPSPVIRGLRPP